jgi:hypothetical protein
MKRVLNTMIIMRKSQSNIDKYLFYGRVSSISALTTEAVLALDGFGMDSNFEVRIDRYKIFNDIDGQGKYLAFIIPTEFGNAIFDAGLGLLQFWVFDLLGFVDNSGKTYDMKVYISPNEYNGIINELKIL